jgi:hypothetical protein
MPHSPKKSKSPTLVKANGYSSAFKALIVSLPILFAVATFSPLTPLHFRQTKNEVNTKVKVVIEDEVYSKDRVFKSRVYADVLKVKGQEYAEIPASRSRPNCPTSSHFKLVRYCP